MDTIHLRLTQEELGKIAGHIDEVTRAAEADNTSRLRRLANFIESWRRRQPEVDVDIAKTMEETPRQRVPLIKWNIQTKLAHDLNALFGEDAEVIAEPEGDADVQTAQKVAHYMDHLLFRKMKMVNPFIVFTLYKLISGRGFAYVPYEKKRQVINGEEKIVYQGPAFYPVHPMNVLVPAGEDVDNLQDLSWFAVKSIVTPDDLLDDENPYINVEENWDKIVEMARQNRVRQRDDEFHELRDLVDQQQGAVPSNLDTGAEGLQMIEWYGSWRLPLNPRKSPAEEDIKQRDKQRTHIVVRVLKDLNLVVGISRLDDLYPGMVHKRPFVDSVLVPDGTFWSEGLAEMLYDLEIALSRNQNLFTRGMQFSIGPVIFADPSSNVGGKSFTYEPFSVYPTPQPDKITQMKLTVDTQAAMVQQQAFLSYAERVAGQTDMASGRTIDRPNAPRTASGTIALIEQGDIRVSLEVRVLKEDANRILKHIWDLDSSMNDGSVFFRVTEEDAAALFGSSRGEITPQERNESYDFELRFATGLLERHTRKQEALALYQIDLQNPLIAQNPYALWSITERLHRAFGDKTFGKLVPQPPPPDAPMQPKEEWTLMLQGEEVNVNPNDNDQLHLVDHIKRLEREKQTDNPDLDAIARMEEHITKQLQQKQQKMLMQTLVDTLTRNLSAQSANPALGGLNVNPPIPLGVQQLQNQLSSIFQPQPDAQGGTV